MKTTKKVSSSLYILIVTILVGLLVAITIPARISNDKSSQAPVNITSSSFQKTYRDGTYKATGSYVTPGGRESIDLIISISDGKAVSTSISQNAKTGAATEYQTKFVSGYKQFVEGKNINEIKLNIVAGSSLTSNGFNKALEQIKNDASSSG